MRTVLLCSLLTVCYLGIFYIWGKTFLKMIHSEYCISESICFGFIVMHVIYQVIYLPFFLSRGSYRSLTILWIIISVGISVFCLVYNARRHERHGERHLSLPVLMFSLLAIALVIWLCILVGLHPRYYHDDGFVYINRMDRMVYHDVMWPKNSALDYHRGFNSFYALFATPCLITGIRPIYMAVYTLRFLGVAMTSIVAYRTGKMLLDHHQKSVSCYALALSMIVPLALMFWSSMYTGQFFFIRTNESKAYCQLILLPLAFSVCAEPFISDTDRTILWKKQMAIGLAAIPVAASAMTSYPILVIISVAALLVFDHFHNTKTTLLWGLACIAPNVIYMIVYRLLK